MKNSQWVLSWPQMSSMQIGKISPVSLGWVLHPDPTNPDVQGFTGWCVVCVHWQLTSILFPEQVLPMWYPWQQQQQGIGISTYIISVVKISLEHLDKHSSPCGLYFLIFTIRCIFLYFLLVIWNSSVHHDLVHFHFLKMPSASQFNWLGYCCSLYFIYFFFTYALDIWKFPFIR